jgi:pimeloyl-ACP methyl ester carboxylesterase
VTIPRILALFSLALFAVQAGAAAITLDSTTYGGYNSAFNAAYETGTGASNIGLLLLHGRNGNPDSAVVRQLRNYLDDAPYGYQTLSIQHAVPTGYTEGGAVPYSAYEADFNNVFAEDIARIHTSMDYLQANGATSVVIVGFSLGSRIGAAYIADQGANAGSLPVAGYVGVGLRGNTSGLLNGLNTLSDPDFAGVPVLDIYGYWNTGTFDAGSGLYLGDTKDRTTAYLRQQAALGNGLDYTQMALLCDGGLIDNDCHKLVGLKGDFSDRDLEIAVGDWIGENVSPVPEPSTMLLMMLGMVTVLGMAVRR